MLAARQARAWSPKHARCPTWWAREELAQQQSSEQARENPHLQKNLGGRRHPRRVPSMEIPPPGTITVQVRMMRHRRAPSVEPDVMPILVAKRLGRLHRQGGSAAA